jgi:hypothetical protein
MLPDFPKTKSEISRLLSMRVRLKTQQLSPFASLPSAFIQHEGNLHSYPQEGFGTVTEGYERFEIPFKVEFDELRQLVGDRLLEKMDTIAEELARKTSEHGYRVLDRVTEQAGNRLDAGGKPFDQEMYLAMLDKVEISFGDDGKPDFVMLMHPTMAETMKARWAEWEQDPVFMNRHERMMGLKREAWRDRESYRKLVD